jgi:Protein of unknown function (DUF3987)
MNAPEPIKFSPEGPQPLLRKLRPAEPYPVDALGPLRRVTVAVQGSTQAPIAIPAASALAIASLAVQGFADVQLLNGSFAPTSLFVLTIALSGERKTSCDRPLMQALRRHERAETVTYEAALTKYRAERDTYDEKKKAALRLIASDTASKRINGEADLKALGDEPRGPIQPYRTASEPTLEGLFRAFIEGQPSLGLFSDEAGQFLGGFGMSKDNRTKTLGGLNKLWDGAEIERTRAGDGVFRLHGRRMAMHLMAQPVVMHEFLADPVASGLGFLPRCLICEPQSTIGSRLSENTRTDPAALDAFSARLTAILQHPMPMWEDGRSLKPNSLHLDNTARALLTRFSDAVEKEQADGKRFAYVTGTASKAAEQAARIAAVLTLWSNLNATHVEADAMSNGIQLAQFYLGEAERLASVASIPEELALAEDLRKWLHVSWPHAEITSGEITQNGPNRVRNIKTTMKAAKALADHGWLVPLIKGTIIRGKGRKTAWRIVRSADVL